MDLQGKLRAQKLANYGNGMSGEFFNKVADELDRLTQLCEEQGRELVDFKQLYEDRASDYRQAESALTRHAEEKAGLDAELSQAREEVTLWRGCYNIQFARAEAAEQRERGLREAFALYGWHSSGCACNMGEGLGKKCSCGFEAALAAETKGEE